MSTTLLATPAILKSSEANSFSRGVLVFGRMRVSFFGVRGDLTAYPRIGIVRDGEYV